MNISRAPRNALMRARRWMPRGGQAARPTRQTGVMDRDRDGSGRPRSARPRDGLGRPLPYGAAGVARQSEGVARTPQQTLQEAQQLLDAGRPFHAHEVFEDAWKTARDAPTATLWKALAQLAVGCTHRLRGNAVGAERLLHRAAAGLAPHLESAPYDVNVAQLLSWAQQPHERAMPRLQIHPRAGTGSDTGDRANRITSIDIGQI
jgi:uncharacterized protein